MDGREQWRPGVATSSRLARPQSNRVEEAKYTVTITIGSGAQHVKVGLWRSKAGAGIRRAPVLELA